MKDKIKVLSVFGTRPEAIKMAPVVKVLDADKNFVHKICVTGQHREMLKQVLDIFEIVPDFDMEIFQHGQTLTGITCRVMNGMEKVFKDFTPDIVLVQGDTSSVFAASLAAFFNGIKVGHVEAGLRSGDLRSPFPEEANRKLTGVLTDLHFSPTETARENLLKEGYNGSRVFVTGNTVIDALLFVAQKDFSFGHPILKKIDFINNKVILLTSHRRENIGSPMRNIFSAVKRIINENDNTEVVYPVHLNPKVREIADDIFGTHDRIHLIEPLEYLEFVNLISKSYIVVTDSGGIQEEAPSLGKPVFVVRKETERPEGIEAGTALLAGIEAEKIYGMISTVLNDENEYNKIASRVNPYGDGFAAEKIRDILLKFV